MQNFLSSVTDEYTTIPPKDERMNATMIITRGTNARVNAFCQRRGLKRIVIAENALNMFIDFLEWKESGGKLPQHDTSSK
ncbi:hypothetical protein [Helicobacter didelphidarum]|uniref:hypothetical protein n=1 Tax=Helicobacter didelphidarum TaxID=2040648 RepID=UPI000E1E4DE0|nr:hypothetical protein [Helicobacter didelphidarum]